MPMHLQTVKGTKAALNMTLTFAGKGAFTAVFRKRPPPPKGKRLPTPKKARARETYEGYITNLKTSPPR